jgi:hypothetical protein
MERMLRAVRIGDVNERPPQFRALLKGNEVQVA